MNLHYRKGSENDIQQLQQLGILSYSQHEHSMSPQNWKKYSAFMSNPSTFTYLLSTSTCFLCENNNDIVGMAFLVSNGHPTEMFEAEWSYIRMVGVHPEFQGKGIAKKLTKMCIDYAQETKENFVALHTSEFMNAARHIYESLNFTIVKELKRYDKKYWIYLLTLNESK